MSVVASTICTCTISYSSALNQRCMCFVAGIVRLIHAFLEFHIIQSMVASPATCKSCIG